MTNKIFTSTEGAKKSTIHGHDNIGPRAASGAYFHGVRAEVSEARGSIGVAIDGIKHVVLLLIKRYVREINSGSPLSMRPCCSRDEH